MSPRSSLRLCTLVVLSSALLFTAAAAQATPTLKPVAWGCAPFTDYGQCRVPGSLSGVTAVAAGNYYDSLALKGDGTVIAWGCASDTDHGQCSVPAGLSGVTAIAAGPTHSLALKGDGTVVAWGCGSGTDFGQCSVPAGLSGVIAIAAGTLHSLAVKNDGTVLAWGCSGGNGFGQCSVPIGLSGVTAIAAATNDSLALKNDGTVFAWGCGSGTDFGQCSIPAGLTGVTAISAGYAHSLALKGDGTVVSWGCGGGYDLGQCSVPNGLSHVTAISAGLWHSLALAQFVDQTISFATLASKTYGDPDFALSASASSGMPVSFTASGNCLLTNAFIHITGAGACTVTASQPGGPNYNPASDVSQTFAIAKAAQSISFGPLPNKVFGAADFAVRATASSGLPIAFAPSGTCILITLSTVHLTSPGMCTLTASQSGNANYSAAAEVSRRFSIMRPPCSVPRVVGKRLGAAKQMITRRHCRTGKLKYAYSRTSKKGIVISQSRRAGKVLPGLSRINLVLSRGRRES